MKKILLLVMLALVCGIAHGETTKTVFNPFSNKLDFITSLNGSSFPTSNSSGCLSNDGSGNLSWAACSGSAGGASVNPATSTVVFPQGMSVSSGIVITNPTVIKSTGVLTSSMTVVLASAPVNTAWITETLPSAASVPGQVFYIAKVDFSTMSIKIQGNGTDVIEGTGTIRLDAQYQHASLYSTGLAWTSGPGGIQYTPNFAGSGLVIESGGTTIASSDTVVCPFYNVSPIMVTGYTYFAASGTGKIVLGIYDNLGNVISSTGPVAYQGFGRSSVTTTPFLLAPGQYFTGVQGNNGNMSMTGTGSPGGNGSSACSFRTNTGASTLLNPYTFTGASSPVQAASFYINVNGGQLGY